MDIYNQIDKSLLGLYSNDRRFIEELREVKQYYEFYEGRVWTPEDDFNDDRGQLWKVKDRDYKPTREVRNITKKLMKKQKRFMTAVQPDIVLSSVDDTDKDRIEDKRILLDRILDNGKFWNKFSKAFLDCTIGKRVLLVLSVDEEDEECPIKFRFYTMPEFTYEYDPNDSDKLLKVQIAYQDKDTVGKIQQEQRWHKWIYEMREDGYCWCTYEIVDGTNTIAFVEVPVSPQINEEVDSSSTQVELHEEWNTNLTQLPCKVIFNDGLTGDIRGASDVKDLMDMATDYNKTVSDYRDALRFKMFEQPVFIDADSTSLQNIKIAPNAIIDLKSDPTLGDGSSSSSIAKAQMLSSTFNFQAAADAYLERSKKDMYECMDQPLPESLVNVASGKALRMLNDDLISRCEEKWQEWDEAILWLLDLIETVVVEGGYYKDLPNIECMSLETTCVLNHNYPIPDDEAETKEIAIKEVEAQVRSHQSYIREFGSQNEADKEFEEILEEVDMINQSNNAMAGLDGMDGAGQMDTEDDTEEDDTEDNEDDTQDEENNQQ